MMREILAETGGVTHRIVQRLNAAAVVAIHEKVERITPELLAVKRLEPERVLEAKRASTIASVVEADELESLLKSQTEGSGRACCLGIMQICPEYRFARHPSLMNAFQVGSSERHASMAARWIGGLVNSFLICAAAESPRWTGI